MKISLRNLFFVFFLLTLVYSADAIVEQPVITSSTSFGTVSIQGHAGIAISIDGVSQGIIPGSGLLDLENIATGEHRVLASEEGYRDQETAIVVRNGEVTGVRCNLTVLPAGRFQVLSTPSNVQVFLDDQYQGITPLTMPGITAGSHRIILKLNGYQDWETIAESKAGEDIQISGNLQPVSAGPQTTMTRSSGPVPVMVVLSCMILSLGCSCLRRRI